MTSSLGVRKGFLLGTGQHWLFQNFLGGQATPLVSGNIFSLVFGAAQDLLGTSGAMEPTQLLFFVNGRKVRAPGLPTHARPLHGCLVLSHPVPTFPETLARMTLPHYPNTGD